MKPIIHKAHTRGHADHGWLNSFHTFSFAGYRDADRMHFGALRVLNDDVIKGGTGFGLHPHDNMEIISIPLSGALEHKDTTGRHEIIRSGEVQIMSAGTGIYHSEHNASRTENANFLQIWIFPKEMNVTPRYEQKLFDEAGRVNKWQVVVSPEGTEGSLVINQDAWFSRIRLDASSASEYLLHKQGNGIYLFVISGKVEAGGEMLEKRDALGVWNTTSLKISSEELSELLVIEVPALKRS